MTELKITQAMLCAAFAIPRSAKLVLISPCGGMAECDVGHEVEPDEYIEATWAAASVPSCEGAKHVESLATLAMNAEKNLAYIRRTFPGGDPRDTDWYAAEVAALVWAHKAAQAAASSGHLDGGACAECNGAGITGVPSSASFTCVTCSTCRGLGSTASKAPKERL